MAELKRCLYIMFLLCGVIVGHIFSEFAMASERNPCQISDKEYFSSRTDAFLLQYSSLNINTVRAVYYIGKPSYNILSKFPSISISTVAIFGSGPQALVTSILVDQGIDMGLLFINSLVKAPQQLSRELGAKGMEIGIQSLNDNYRLYKKGFDNLTAKEKEIFRNNQMNVDMLGSAKKLYLRAGEDRDKYSSFDSELQALDSFSDEMLDTKAVKVVLTAAKISEIFARSNLNLHGYRPFVDYVNAMDIIADQWGCIRELASLPKSTTESKFGVSGHSSGESAECVGGSINACRKQCFTSCDYTNDGRIHLSGPEIECYSVCNRSCDHYCLGPVNLPSQQVAKKDSQKKQNTLIGAKGSRVLMELVIDPRSQLGDLSGTGLRIVGPNKELLTCNKSGKQISSFGRCLGKQQFGKGTFSEGFELKILRTGTYFIEIYVPDTSPTVVVPDGMIRLYGQNGKMEVAKPIRNINVSPGQLKPITTIIIR